MAAAALAGAAPVAAKGGEIGGEGVEVALAVGDGVGDEAAGAEAAAVDLDGSAGEAE